ncbi:heavy metal-binding domain-containing protein [Flaviramulus aquimarinus]|uniref:Heavy metal-binding domain-containing protein n=1 Tax=Flaviramulus aquimarinus TaxID=1170456 RepID=A0ABP9F1M9_9FLAO
MILTTTNTIEGYKIVDYLGIVSGVGANNRKASFSFKIEKFLESLENSINEVKEDAFQKLKQNALKLQANAVVGIDIDFETLPDTTYILVSVTGTAVKVSQ